MTLAARFKGAVLLLLFAALATLALLLSHNSAPVPLQALDSNDAPMKAVLRRQYGSPDVLEIRSVARPTPARNELLIRVRAASVNPLDWHTLRGTPYVMRLQAGFGRPRTPQLGVDFAGTVAAIGADVTHFKVGDEIFGTANGSLAEYAVSTEAGLALKPDNLTFQQAAAVPVAGLTALQALRDKGLIGPGQKVLINGASGGVGTFAVQIAKAMGAEVTGVTSTANLQMVRSLGADQVVDYSREDYTSGTQRYDVIVDTVGNQSLRNNCRVLTPRGILVLVGGSSENSWLGPVIRLINGQLLRPFVSQKIVSLLADSGSTADMNTLRDLMQTGRLLPTIDRQYNFDETPEAFRYLEKGHARGKVVINVN